MSRRRFTEEERMKIAQNVDALRQSGLTNKQIANRLNLKIGTISSLWFRYIGYKKKNKDGH